MARRAAAPGVASACIVSLSHLVLAQLEHEVDVCRILEESLVRDNALVVQRSMDLDLSNHLLLRALPLQLGLRHDLSRQLFVARDLRKSKALGKTTLMIEAHGQKRRRRRGGGGRSVLAYV